jgi:predicted metal-dependent hydrolase
MASKTFTVDGIGEVTVYKRRGSKRLNLRIVSNKIRVTQPTWLPYNSGLQFAKSNTAWIAKQRNSHPLLELNDGLKVGKTYTLQFEPAATLRTRLTSNKIVVYIPPHLTLSSPSVQSSAKNALKRALKKESESLLPNRVANMAESYGFDYSSIKCKSMRTRWGSCNNQKIITLNIYLMMLPWDLIDYVLLHELTHTKHLHHGKSFWRAMEELMPDFKERRKSLKMIQQTIAPMQ